MNENAIKKRQECSHEWIFPEEWRRKSNEPGKWTYRWNIPKAFADSFKTLIMHSKEINRKHREHEPEEGEEKTPRRFFPLLNRQIPKLDFSTFTSLLAKMCG